MSKQIPLDALVRRVSRLVEQMFDKQGDIDPSWLAETASGEQITFVTPIYAPTPLAAAKRKDEIAEELRAMFAEREVVRYAYAVECWMGSLEKELTQEQVALRYAAAGYTFASHPDRREVVQVSGEDATEALHAFRDIIRPAHGKPYLGKLGPIERMEHMESRWLGLLPNAAHAAAARERPPAEAPRYVRFTSELPDDVGHPFMPFMTEVPGAPLQIAGLRDPANGELCVGAVWLPKDPTASSPWSELPEGLELVTGPEAERLILSVHRLFTERADAEGLTFDEYMARLGRHSDDDRRFWAVYPRKISALPSSRRSRTARPA